MIAKVFFLLAVVAAAHGTGLLGVGAPVLAAGHLGGISAQSTAINHVAPARAYGAPLALGHGIAAAPLGYGIGAAAPLAYGIGATPLAVGHGLIGGNVRADGIVGSGILGARYGSAIAHNAIVGHGIGYGIGHGIGYGIGHGAILGLGH